MRRTYRQLGIAGGLFAAFALAPCSHSQDRLLEVQSSTLTTGNVTTSAANAPAQPVQLSCLHRGAFLDGSVRRDWLCGAVVAPNGADPAPLGDAKLADVRLATGEYAPVEVDLALPSPGLSWVVGRSRTPLLSSAGVVHGAGWYQLSQPQLVVGANQDTMYLVYAGDAFLEFRRVFVNGAMTSVFRGTNGTAGALVLTTTDGGSQQARSARTAAGGGSPGVPSSYWTYHDPAGNEIVFFGQDGSWSSSNARLQLWKMTDAAGYTTYVGDPNDMLTAIVSGYDSLGRIKLAVDSAGRTYSYVYGTDGAINRLLRVVVVNGVGVEVGRVEYDYYDASTPDSSVVLYGTLRMATITTPLTTPSAGNAPNLSESTYYRYWTSSSGSPVDGFQRGGARSVRLVVRPEGMRRASIAFGTALFAQSDATVMPYASDRIGYSGGRVAQLSMSGLSTRRWDLAATAAWPPPSSAGYDATWANRVDVSLYRIAGTIATLERVESQFVDEVGQRLSSIVAPSLGHAQQWCSYVERDAAGCVIRVGTPASVSSGDVASGTFTPAPSGLTARIARDTSGGPLHGFALSVGHSQGWATSYIQDSSVVYQPIGGIHRPSKDLGAYVVRRPLIAESRLYADGGPTDAGVATFFQYTLPPAAWDSSEALGIAWMRIVAPAVSTTEHGSGISSEMAIAFLPNGRVWLERTMGGAHAPLVYRRFAMPGQTSDEPNGLPVLTVYDADPTLHGFSPPANFPGGSIHPVSAQTDIAYDAQCRVSSISTPAQLTTSIATANLRTDD